MADNLSSYSRFATLPLNIGDYGWTPEEVKLQRGNPDRNPALNPLAAPLHSVRRLFLRPAGSDQLRLGEPGAPAIDPYEGAQSNLSLSRGALRKLSNVVLGELAEHVQHSTNTEVQTRTSMLDSFRRVAAMRAYLTDLTRMTENIYVRSVAANRS